MLYILFFLTGAAGLIYEISWSRQIGIFFGHTVNAAAVVLAAYFGGMALGYALAGRLSRRLREPLYGYASCELCVALWALLTPLILGLFKLAPVAALLNSEVPALQTAARIVAALIVLLPATLALGATLPFVAQHLARQGEAAAQRRTTTAYALNTAGAVLGVLLATFVLILQAGVAGSSYIAAAVSATCGLGALWLAGRKQSGAGSEAEAAAQTEPDTAQGDAGLPGPRSWLVLAALSGFGTLGLQVLYVRLFSMTFNNSTYTFGGIVAVFLLSLAAGSALFARWGRRASVRAWAAWACLGGACAIPASVWLFQNLTLLRYFDVSGGFWAYIGAALLLIAAVITLPVLLLALLLPVVWAGGRAAEIRSAAGTSLAAAPVHGELIGRLTALNTVAATAGSLLCSFVLLPLLGLWHCFWLLAGLYLLAGALLLDWRSLRGPRLGLAALLGLGCLVGAKEMDLDLVGRAGSQGFRYLYLKDSAYGRIDVIEKLADGSRYLRQNRHYNLGGTVGDDSELRQGRLPLLLQRDPQRVCFLGLATGITASSAILDPRVQDATAVELIPEVAQAARLFDPHNSGVMDDPRMHVVVNDARYFLYATPQKFDVIVSDLFVPWHSQTGYLYTVEHYQAARQRLAPGGIFCQWLPLYQLGPRELELILNSFSAVFPCTSLWLDQAEQGGGTLAIIGSEAPLQVSEVSVAMALRRSDPGPEGVMDPQLDSVRDLREDYIGDWPLEHDEDELNTDENPRVEFLAPLAHGQGELLSGRRWDDFRLQKLSGLKRENVRFGP